MPLMKIETGFFILKAFDSPFEYRSNNSLLHATSCLSLFHPGAYHSTPCVFVHHKGEHHSYALLCFQSEVLLNGACPCIACLSEVSYLQLTAVCSATRVAVAVVVVFALVSQVDRGTAAMPLVILGLEVLEIRPTKGFSFYAYGTLD